MAKAPMMTYVTIGRIDNGCDGVDMFIKVTGDDDITVQQAEEWASKLFYQDSRGPGSPYCTYFAGWRNKNLKNSVIVEIHSRYDV